MLNTNNTNFIQTQEQLEQLNKYANHNRNLNCIWPFKQRITFKARTVSDIDIELTNVPGNAIFGGTLLKIAAAKEILSIPTDEPKEKRKVLADAYVLAKVQKKCQSKVKVNQRRWAAFWSGVGISCAIVYAPSPVPVAGAVGACFLPLVILNSAGAHFANKAKKDAKEIKELTETFLLADKVNVSKYLEKVDFSKMDLQESKSDELGPMRKGISLVPGLRRGISIECLPINTERTRKHLYTVFGTSRALSEQLKRIINDPDNFSECPNRANTEGRRFSVKGWRNILALCVDPENADQSHPAAAATYALAPSTTSTVTTIPQLPPPSYDSIFRSCDQITTKSSAPV